MIMPGYELIGQEELESVTNVFKSGGGVLFRHGFDAMRNNQYAVRGFELEFAERIGGGHALAVSSGTAALRICLAALGVGVNDEVITQSFTFVATVEAIVESGAVPVIAEIDQSLGIDVSDLESKITPRTKAVILVHMLGNPGDAQQVRDFCERKGLFLIEDTAWGCGAKLHGVNLGNFGHMAAFSFDHAKIITTGEGGMVYSNDAALIERARAWHDHGHENNPSVPRWEDTRLSSGFNFRMSELQGAVGRAQLAKLDEILHAQRYQNAVYEDVIAKFAEVSVIPVLSGAEPSRDSFMFRAADAESASRIRAALVKRGRTTKILPEATSWHFAMHWTHIPSLVARHGGPEGLRNSLSKSTKNLESVVSIPIFVEQTESESEILFEALVEALRS